MVWYNYNYNGEGVGGSADVGEGTHRSKITGPTCGGELDSLGGVGNLLNLLILFLLYHVLMFVWVFFMHSPVPWRVVGLWRLGFWGGMDLSQHSNFILWLDSCTVIMSSIHVISWNVNGLNGQIKRTACLDILRRQNVDVAFIQESHLRTINVRREQALLCGCICIAGHQN